MNGFFGRLWERIIGSSSPENGSPVAGGGLIGSDLATARAKNDFFLFFNFESIGEEKLPDGTMATSFKPTGEAFRALVTLHVTTNEERIIRKLHLVVARGFIANPGKCIYAADLAQSFLRCAAAAAPGDPISLLGEEIGARARTLSSMPMITAKTLPTASGPPSAGYRTYVGNLQPQVLLYKGNRFQLAMSNEQRPDEALHLVVSPT